MELNLDTGKGHYHIRGYGVNFIQVNDKKIDHSIIITPNKLIDPWLPQSLAELTTADFQALFDLNPTIVLLGTGPRLTFPNPTLLANFYAKKIGVEVMDTAAACRTYTVLMAEERQVAAALLLK